MKPDKHILDLIIAKSGNDKKYLITNNFDKAANPDSATFKIKTSYNPNSLHVLGSLAKNIIDRSEETFKKLSGYDKVHFIPGGGTTANLFAINTLPFYPKKISRDVKINKILISAIEHKSISKSITKELSQRGYDIIIVPIQSNGLIDVKQFEKILTQHSQEIALISIINVNNETGVIQDIPMLVTLTKSICPNTIFHSDICQGVMLASQYSKTLSSPDIMTFSMYKLGGMHLGIVVTNLDIKTESLGTPDVALIEHSALIIQDYFLKYNAIKLSSIKSTIVDAIKEISEKLDLDIINISLNSVPNIATFVLPKGYESAIVQKKLSQQRFYIGTGSACSSIDKDQSQVLAAYGYGDYTMMRFSFNENNSNIGPMMEHLYEILSHMKSLVNAEKIVQNVKSDIRIIINNTKPTTTYQSLDLTLDVPTYIPETIVRLSSAELYLKGANKKKFLDILKNQVLEKIGSENKSLVKMVNNTILIEKYLCEDLSATFAEIPGIAKISNCYFIPYNNEDLQQLIGCCVAMLTNCVTFRLTIKYSGKKLFHNLSASQLTERLGAYLTTHLPIKVDLKNFNLNIKIIMGVEGLMIPFLEFNGAGGLPRGISGRALLISKNGELTLREKLSIKMAKTRGSTTNNAPLVNLDERTIKKADYLIIEPSVYNQPNFYVTLKVLEDKYQMPCITNTNLLLCDNDDDIQVPKHTDRILMLLSGGIDSPVASYLLLKAGYQVDFIHFTADIDKTKNILDLRKILNPLSRLLVIDFKNTQEKIVTTCNESYRTIMYKIFMVLIANKIAVKDYVGIATGNNLGQVASQTIQNIKCTHLVSKLPLISPLFGYNKNEIIKIAREINTFKPSTCDSTNDCCTMYMPKHPITNSNYDTILKYIEVLSDCLNNINVTEL